MRAPARCMALRHYCWRRAPGTPRLLPPPRLARSPVGIAGGRGVESMAGGPLAAGVGQRKPGRRVAGVRRAGGPPVETLTSALWHWESLLRPRFESLLSPMSDLLALGPLVFSMVFMIRHCVGGCVNSFSSMSSRAPWRVQTHTPRLGNLALCTGTTSNLECGGQEPQLDQFLCAYEGQSTHGSGPSVL